MVCRIQYVTNEGRVHRKTKGETMTDEVNQEVKRSELLQLTAEIVAAYARNNVLSVDNLCTLIASVHEVLSKVGNTMERPKPAVPISESVTSDRLVCLECGGKFKMLKKHLRSAHDMMQAQYRKRWGLPGNYPMVTSTYSKFRVGLAKHIGLGKRHRGTVHSLAERRA